MGQSNGNHEHLGRGEGRGDPRRVADVHAQTRRGLTQAAVFLAAAVAAALAGLGAALLGLALRHLPLGTAYAIWTGIGTIGTAMFGMVMLGEPAGALRLGSMGLIVAGIIGLKLLTPA
mgnify:CR=1 FL=1